MVSDCRKRSVAAGQLLNRTICQYLKWMLFEVIKNS